MKKHKKLPIRSVCFHVPIYGFDVLVIIGAKTADEVIEQMKKQRVNIDVAKKFVGNENFHWLLEQEAGSLVTKGKLEIIYLFKEWKDTPHFQRILVHEVSHMVDTIAEHRNMAKETEARAYLSDYLFDTLRKNM